MWLALVAVGAALVAGCGDDDDEGSTEAEPSVTSPSDPNDGKPCASLSPDEVSDVLDVTARVVDRFAENDTFCEWETSDGAVVLRLTVGDGEVDAIQYGAAFGLPDHQTVAGIGDGAVFVVEPDGWFGQTSTIRVAGRGFFLTLSIEHTTPEVDVASLQTLASLSYGRLADPVSGLQVGPTTTVGE